MRLTSCSQGFTPNRRNACTEVNRQAMDPILIWPPFGLVPVGSVLMMPMVNQSLACTPYGKHAENSKRQTPHGLLVPLWREVWNGCMADQEHNSPILFRTERGK
jgi:hypothetical protein